MALIRFLSMVALLFAFIFSCTELDTYTIELEPGDNFQVANDLYPAGTTFIVKSGIHKNQTVHNPKTGNSWIGEMGAILDGTDETSEAFSGRVNNITIEGLEIRNYVDNGIHFSHGENLVLNRLNITDTGSGTGDENGAIRLYRIQNIYIGNSNFSRTSSAILPTYCRGPVVIELNSGLNIGRNFVQLDKCNGPGIVVRYNSMERRGDYLRTGAHDVVDWISVFQSTGTEESPIRISYNRARGHGNDRYGSFIMLGDEGGRHQIARGNAGVNPGQVGIGIAGGEDIKVHENLMFSRTWEHSNVAYYSANYSDPFPCANHQILNNQSYWISNTLQRQNNVWSDQKCTPVIGNNIFPDMSLNYEIWYRATARFNNGKGI